MKFQFVRALLIFAALTTGGAAHAADVQFPAGSRIGIAPPAGFTSSQAFRGFNDPDSKAAILMLEMPKPAFAEITKVMTADDLKRQGITMDKRENLTLKTGKATLISGYQEANGEKMRKWILVAETADMTALVSALVPETAKTAHPDADVRAALISLDVREKVPVEEMLGLLPFKMDDLANLRPFRVEPNTVFLTEGPKDSLDTNEQPLLVISAATGGPSENPQRDIFARNMFSGVPGYTNVQILGTDIIRLGGFQTHQILAEGKDEKTGDPVKLVQWMRFGNGAFIRLLGIAKSDAWPEAFPRFRTVRDALNGR